MNLIDRSHYKEIAAELRERLAARMGAASEPRLTITPFVYYA